MKREKKVGIENKIEMIGVLLVLALSIFIMIINTSFVLGAEYSSESNSYGSSYNVYGSSNYNTYGEGRVYGSSSNPQFYASGFSGFKYESPQAFWSDYGKENCYARQDLILQIVPGGCSPAVVRSDLLEEQNVPVFCKVMAIQINPLIDISRIRSLRFTRQYPKGISGVSYFPARAAVGGKKVFSDSIFEDNLGYLVVVLSRTNAEKDMPDFIAGNITAVVDYDSEGSFGIGDTNFYLSEMSEQEWERDYKDYGFWNGKGYVRVDSIESDRATISVYRDYNSRQSTVTLRKGETSKDIFLSGFYCAAGMNIRLDEIGYPVDSALLQVNDEQIWVAKNDRILDNKCRVLDLETYGGGGKIKIKCSSIREVIELSLNPGKAEFIILGNPKQITFGEKVKENIFLGYIGQDSENKRYVVLVKDGYSDTVYEFADKEVYDCVDGFVDDEEKIEDIKRGIGEKVIDCYVKKISKKEKEIKEKVSVEVIEEGEEGSVDFSGIKLSEVLIAQNIDWDIEGIDNNQILAKEYYDDAIQNYNDLIDFYPNEKMEFVDEDPYAAKGLLEAAELSRRIGMNEKAYDFYKKLLDEYPNSDSASSVRRKQELVLKYDTSDSKASVNIHNEHFFIDLLDFKKPSSDELSAVLLIDSEDGKKEHVLELNEMISVSRGGDVYKIEVVNIRDDYIDIEYKKTDGNKNPRTKKKRLSLRDKQDDFDDLDIKLVKINLEEQVKLSIDSKGYGPRTESSFGFKIGIEKRLIELSPEKAESMMKDLKETIKTLENINKNLGNAIKSLKAACFATSAILTAKNLIKGASGESMARGIIMTSSGGWNEKCEKLVNDGLYDTIHECLLDKSDEIKKDVEIYASEIQETNDMMKKIQDRVGDKKTDIFDFQGQVDSKKIDDEFKKDFKKWCEKVGDKKIELIGKQKSEVVFGDDDDSICKWETMTHEQRKDIMTLYKIKNAGGSSVLGEVVDREMQSVLLNAKNYHDYNEERIKAEKEAGEANLGVRTTYPENDKIVYGYIKTISVGDKEHDIYGEDNFEKGDSVVRIYIPSEKDLGGGSGFVLGDELEEDAKKKVREEIGGKQVIVEIVKSPDEDFYIPKKEGGKVFLVSGKKVSEDSKKEVLRYMGIVGLNQIKQSDKTAYENKMKNPENLFVKYFERAPYKGLPAEVPFDIENGWYVEMTYVLSGFGKPYDESGRVINFYICNVGANGFIEFKKSADDICRYYNVESGADLNFPGMSLSDSNNLINKAQRAIQEAARQYGKERVLINGQSFETGTSFGGEEGRCTDFMSPGDCTLLFNVCDPVICPASRCDFGGRYRVDNVIQSGIIGSLLLCLPNYKEGVFVPICLTGIHAGLDGYISILNSAVDCLNESIETGRNIGICDEIRSIYLCEFFWRQAAPLVEVLIPRMFEGIYSQGVRGGGEYLTVQTAWENTKSAVGYFTNTYAVNSMQAFSARSLGNAGTGFSGIDICKSFISTSTSDLGGIFETLIEPDSPIQYHAWFSESEMTSATIPPVSHYKVYYHIYSGKDIGAYYVVYLKDLVDTGYFASTGTYVVDRGYIKRGSQVDEARDFVAVSGYKQLCISVNGREECGFGKVSTSYFLNSLTDSYVEEQMETRIVSEKECVAGTSSLSSLVNPNLQAGVEEAINPELYNKGIIRVCASANPGKQVLPSGEYDNTNSSYDKWKIVGYCDDPAIKCWLDTESVRDIIKDKQIEEQVLDKIDKEYLFKDNYWTQEKSRDVGDRTEGFIKGLEISEGERNRKDIDEMIEDTVEELNELTELGFFNVHKARGFYLLGNLYKKVVEELWGEVEEGGIDVFEEVISTIKSEKVEGGGEKDDSFRGGDGTEEEGDSDVGGESVKISKARPVVFGFANVDEFVGYKTIIGSKYIFFRYNDGEWYWFFDKDELLENIDNGFNVELTNGDDYDLLEDNAKETLKKLSSKDYEQGVKFFIDKVSSRKGIVFGIWAGKLYVYIKGENKIEYKAGNPLLEDSNKFIEKLNNKIGPEEEIELKKDELISDWKDDDLKEYFKIELVRHIKRSDGYGDYERKEYKHTQDGWESKDNALKNKECVEGIVCLIDEMETSVFWHTTIYIYWNKEGNDNRKFVTTNYFSKQKLIESVLEFLKSKKDEGVSLGAIESSAESVKIN